MFQGPQALLRLCWGAGYVHNNKQAAKADQGWRSGLYVALKQCGTSASLEPVNVTLADKIFKDVIK